MTDLSARREAAESELHTLRSLRGQAMLDGQAFEGQSRINQLTAELEALVVAEGLQAERQRAEEERARLARLADLRGALAAETERYFEYIEREEAACRNQVDMRNMATAAAANMGRLTHLITNSAIPMPLLAGDIESRGAMLTASVMAQIKGQSRGRFGHVEWQASGLYSPTANWRAREEKILMSHLRPIIAGALPRPEENLAIEAPSKERDNVATINGNVELAAQAS